MALSKSEKTEFRRVIGFAPDNITFKQIEEILRGLAEDSKNSLQFSKVYDLAQKADFPVKPVPEYFSRDEHEKGA